MTTDVGVPGGGRARDPIISLTKRGPLRRSNALDPPLAAILSADAIPLDMRLDRSRTKHFSAGTCTDQQSGSVVR